MGPEGFRILYNGENIFQKQLALFSICGIVGLFTALITINGFDSFDIISKCAYIVLWLCFSFYFVGFETLFLHMRKLPEIDSQPFKIMTNRILIFIFLIGIPLFVMQIFPKYALLAFLIELLISVPLTAIQVGFSYNFIENDIWQIFKNINFKNYIKLLFKRLWLIFEAYLFTLVVVFFVFFIAGVVIAIIYRGNVPSIVMVISSNQHIITKLSNIISGILLLYSLTIVTLTWDFEVAKMLEQN